MRWKSLVMIVAALALAACETTETNTGAASGSGNAAVRGGGTADIRSNELASRGAVSGINAGTQEDLVTNVGDRVFFDLDSFQLESDAQTTLEKQAAWLRQNPRVVVTIEGHADERGTREYNLALGERRATATRDYLVALGIEQNRFKTVSFGKERPVDPRSEKEAWAKNRRGVMVVN
jgi:peptidoglycan-associated lipoprotein